MSKPILDNLFGSRIRVKILKFLFRNYPVEFTVEELAGKIQEIYSAAKQEVEILAELRLIKKTKTAKVKYFLNPGFEFFEELRALVLKASPAEKNKMVSKILKLGRIKLAVISGVFLNSDGNGSNNSTADLFIVGDEINKDKLRTFLKALEAEVGREIKLGIMDKEEFDYRYGMFDRFVRVMLESPHEKIINKLGL
ncbi:MAG: winged helix-turn-helix transcriptional regulator [Candidatus Yanofskybacteria bacterium]|nr:winged helix-turn-helix transcriptional regulator [Candidatus Yanofskybacteria bacterium]